MPQPQHLPNLIHKFEIRVRDHGSEPSSGGVFWLLRIGLTAIGSSQEVEIANETRN